MELANVGYLFVPGGHPVAPRLRAAWQRIDFRVVRMVFDVKYH